MGKRIYNGTSGVVPAAQELRNANAAAHAAMWANLLPSVRQRYLEQAAEQAREGRGTPVFSRRGKSASH